MKKILAFLSILSGSFFFLIPSVFANVHGMQTSPDAYKYLAAALAIAIAAFGGAIAQGNAVKAALEAIGRNPGASDKVFTPMIIGLALIESLVIYALLVSLLLLFAV